MTDMRRQPAKFKPDPPADYRGLGSSSWNTSYGLYVDPIPPSWQHRPADDIGVVTSILWEEIMQRILSMLAIGICAGVPAAGLVLADTPEVTLTRLDCGTPAPPTDVAQRFTDTYAYNGVKIQLVYSCYLIKHGDDYMVWDTGHAMTTPDRAPKVSLVDQLGKLELKPESIKYVGISHYHGDHVGQAGSFAKSTLLIGKADWEVLTVPAKATPAANPASFAPWISGGSMVEPVAGDKDVFGDGTVVMLNTPGHTPGHHSLMVKLQQTGYVLLTGDLAHFRENYDSNGVPNFNTHRGDTLASLDRFKKIAANLKATVIIQHDERDIAKLPAFPAPAK
jgi:glyoxylase-like metal-dependent hydrolase (beta-lactamase superfamily II)